MKYKKKDLGSYNVHMIQTDKYKTITMRIVFRRKIKKEEITIRNVLTSLLVQSSEKYNTKRKLTIKTQDLYSVGLGVNNVRQGNYFHTVFTLNCLNDNYTEEGNFVEAINFLSEILFHPDVEDNAFKEKNIEIVKNKTKDTLMSMKEDANAYSLVRAYEAFDKDSPISYRMIGYLEDLDNINGQNLYDYYKSILKNDLVDIFIIGDFREDQVLSEIRKLFKFRILKKANLDYRLKNKRVRARRLFARETIKNNQSKVNIICRYHRLKDYEINYVLPIYNCILGGESESKLFRIVREEHSLCYGISSAPSRLDNTLTIHTGIDKENYKKTLTLIEKILDDMKKGKFTEQDIETAKQFYETAFEEVEESPNTMIEIYMNKDFIGTDDLETKRKMIKKVTKKEIIRVARKIKMDTVFMLEGDKNEKE